LGQESVLVSLDPVREPLVHRSPPRSQFDEHAAAVVRVAIAMDEFVGGHTID